MKYMVMCITPTSEHSDFSFYTDDQIPSIGDTIADLEEDMHYKVLDRIWYTNTMHNLSTRVSLYLEEKNG